MHIHMQHTATVMRQFYTYATWFRGGSRIFSQGGSGSQCHWDACVEGTEGGVGGLPQENLEYEVL